MIHFSPVAPPCWAALPDSLRPHSRGGGDRFRFILRTGHRFRPRREDQLSGPAAFPNQAAADVFGAAQKEKRSATKVADSSDGLKPAQITAAVSKLAAQVSAMEEEVEA